MRYRCCRQLIPSPELSIYAIYSTQRYMPIGLKMQIIGSSGVNGFIVDVYQTQGINCLTRDSEWSLVGHVIIMRQAWTIFGIDRLTALFAAGVSPFLILVPYCHMQLCIKLGSAPEWDTKNPCQPESHTINQG